MLVNGSIPCAAHGGTFPPLGSRDAPGGHSPLPGATHGAMPVGASLPMLMSRAEVRVPGIREFPRSPAIRRSGDRTLDERSPPRR